MEHLFQAVHAVPFFGPGDAAIGADQHRRPGVDGDATNSPGGGSDQFGGLLAGRGVEEDAFAILHEFVERAFAIFMTDRPVADQPPDVVPVGTEVVDGRRGRSSSRRSVAVDVVELP